MSTKNTRNGSHHFYKVQTILRVRLPGLLGQRARIMSPEQTTHFFSFLSNIYKFLISYVFGIDWCIAVTETSVKRFLFYICFNLGII